MKQDPADKAQRAMDELRALIREAHKAAQELRAAAKAARVQVDGYLHNEVQTAMDAYTSQMQAAVDSWGSEARADVLRVMRNLNEAMDSVCKVVVNGLRDPDSPTSLTADIVIDLRGSTPAMMPGDSERGRAVLADAQFQVVVGPKAGAMWSTVRPPQDPNPR